MQNNLSVAQKAPSTQLLQPEHGSSEHRESEQLNNIKTTLTEFLNSPSDDCNPQQIHLTNALSGLHNKEDKLRFLELAFSSFCRNRAEVPPPSTLQKALTGVFEKPSEHSRNKASQHLNNQTRKLMQSKSRASRMLAVTMIHKFPKTNILKAWSVAEEMRKQDVQRAIMLLNPESMKNLDTESRKITSDTPLSSRY